jgi:hypothetical protein
MRAPSASTYTSASDVANARTSCIRIHIEVATARISVHLSPSILIQWSIPHVSALDLVPSPVGHSGDVEGCCLSLLG